MRPVWIDTSAYIGPCRRGRRGVRMLERRRHTHIAAPPSLKTLIRQLRVTELAHASEEALSAFRLRLAAALERAQQTGEAECGEVLRELLQTFDRAGDVRQLSDFASTLPALQR